MPPSATVESTPFTAAADATLLAAWRTARSAEALQTLIARHVDWVYASAVRQAGADAPDVTQATFILFWQKAHRLRTDANVAAWLASTVRYVAMNARRAAVRRQRHERATATLISEATMQNTPADAAPELARLDDAIASLGTQDRAAIVLRYLRGEDVAAVAESLGVSPKTAQKRIERATDRLRRWFEKRPEVVAARRQLVAGGRELVPPASPRAVTVGVVAAALAATFAHAGTAPAAVTRAAMTAQTLKAAPAALLAKGTIRMIRWTQLKLAGAVVAAVAVSGTGATIVRHALADTFIPPPQRNEAAIAAGAMQFAVTLSDGVTVDLFFADNANPQAWWKVDGSPAANVDWQPTQTQPIAKPNARQIVVQIHPGQSPKPPTLIGFSFDGKFGVDNGLGLNGKAGVNFGQLTGLLNAFPPGQTTTTAKISVGIGAFTPIPHDQITMMANADGVTYSGHTPSGAFVISKPFIRQGQVAVTISSHFTDNAVERQWVAEGWDGKLSIGHTVEGTTAGDLAQTVQAFPLADPKQIKSITLQTRPVEWEEFKNVSLIGGTITPVTITTGVEHPPATQAAAAPPAPAGEYYIGGSVARPGVYSLAGKRTVTLITALESAGAADDPGLQQVTVIRRAGGKDQTIVQNASLAQLLADGSAERLALQPQDFVQVKAAPAAMKTTPFTDIRWTGGIPQIEVAGVWYTWVAIDGQAVADLVAQAKAMDAVVWQKRVGEDLAELLARGGHPAGDTVTLVVQPLDGGAQKTLDQVPMTAENRRSVYQHRVEREAK